MEERCSNKCGSGKVISITYSTCVALALLIENEKRMRRIILPPMVCLAKLVFPYKLKKETQFWSKYTSNVSWILSTNFWLKQFILLEVLNEIFSKMYSGRPVRYPLFFSDVNDIWNSSADFRKVIKCTISWSFVQCWPRCSMQTDRQTDRYDAANSRFSNIRKRN